MELYSLILIYSENSSLEAHSLTLEYHVVCGSLVCSQVSLSVVKMAPAVYSDTKVYIQ